MKKLLITSLILFLVGLIFRFLHWPGASAISILSVTLILIFAFLNSFKQENVYNISILGGWVLSIWSVHILFNYLYWYTGAMLLIALLLTLVYIVISVLNQEGKVSKIVFRISIIGVLLSFVPAYSICYLFDLNDLINKENKEINFYSWDKYSWFLYIRGEKERALEANNSAIDAWHKDEGIYRRHEPSDSIILSKLKDHRKGISNVSWTEGYIRYPFKYDN